ncbi:FeoA family protein [Porticoccus sp. W117]|uniref:FeoA family protein n=1 Tax=Porticoccus sp. W117 TaxID=3054777 RepID=UPI0025963E23|nr:FeoA family protein [Porticoccus sp. W117]MDM3870390.1 FeoA family protein [Porticoccus sp. W117]
MTDTSLLLADLTIGDHAIIRHYNGIDADYRNRLMSLGLTPGTPFSIEQVAPLGDPMDIQVRGFRLSLRRAEAGNIKVEKI